MLTAIERSSGSSSHAATPEDVPLNLADLRMFLVVASEGSFSRAADRVYRTQSAISQAIRRLEQDVGQWLFVRSSNPIQLTSAGIVLRTYGEQLFALCGEARAGLERLSARANRIVIGTAETAAHAALPLIARFSQLRPDVAVDVRTAAASELIGQVASGTLHFAVSSGRVTNKGLACVDLARDRLVALIDPRHAFARRRHVRLEELQNIALIMHTDSAQEHRGWSRMVELRQSMRYPLMTIQSLDTIKRMLVLRSGAALLPQRCADAEIARGELTAVPVMDAEPITLQLIHQQERHLPAAAGPLVAFAREYRRTGLANDAAATV